MTERLIVIGAGGFGREALDVVAAASDAGADIELVGVLDANPNDQDLELLAQRNIPYLGREGDWLDTVEPSVKYVVAIGSPAVRRAVAARFDARGLQAATVVHPRAVIGTQSRLGAGIVIAAGALVSTNVTLDDHVHLNPGCIVGHDSHLESFVSVNPGAIVSGNVRVRTGTLIGAGATVLQGLTVGQDSVVGAAACVTRDVGSGLTVRGVPAR